MIPEACGGGANWGRLPEFKRRIVEKLTKEALWHKPNYRR